MKSAALHKPIDMILLIGVLFISLERSSAFTSYSICSKYRISDAGKGKAKDILLSSTQSDQYDDWYDDFDPSQFEDYNQNSFSSSSYVEHDYTRDEAADNSNVDLDEVNHLIAERLIMRKSRRFNEADAIRDELLEKHGVLIRDREKMWRSGCSASGSGRRWSPQTRNGSRRPPKDFGPNGHDYNLAADSGPNQSSLSLPEIHQMLAERLECKLNRDYRNADRLQEELLNAGVVINDRKREWRADGAVFNEFTSRKYVQSEFSTSTEYFDEIQAMVDERAKAKSERLYKKADEIRDVLFHEYDVTINDKRSEWSVGGSFGEVENRNQRFRPFEKSPSSPSTENDETIQQMVEERDAARANRDYRLADTIRDELKEMNVFVDDDNRQWSVGKSSSSLGDYNRRGGGSLSDDEVEKITGLLKRRFEYKVNRKFKSADKIRDQLRDTYSIQIDDRNKEWHVVTSDYAMSASSAPVSEETQEAIQKLVVERASAKLQKDYATADSIRDLLMERYNVSVDDRVKEWKRLDNSTCESDDETPNATASGEEEEDYEIETSVNGLGEESLESSEEEDSEIEASVNGEESLDSIETLDKLTIPVLKEKLRSMGLPVSGKKAELIQRILDNGN